MKLHITILVGLTLFVSNPALAENFHLDENETLGTLNLSEALELPQTRSSQTRSIRASYFGGTVRLARIKPQPGRGVKLTCTAPTALNLEYILEAVTQKLTVIHTAQGSWGANRRKTRWSRRFNDWRKVFLKVVTERQGRYKSTQTIRFNRFGFQGANFSLKIRNYVGGVGSQASYCNYTFAGPLGRAEVSL